MTSGSAQPAAALSPVRGILLFACGLLVLACMDTTIKYLSAHYQVPLIVGVRFVVNCLLMIVVLGPAYGRRLVQTRRTGLVLVRAGCLATASILLGFTFSRLPVAEATAIVYLSPTIVMLLARPLLGERIGMLGCVAAVAGFGGMLLIARPGAGLEPLGVALGLAAAGVTAVYQLLSRVLAPTEGTMALLFHAVLVSAIAFGLAAPWFWDGRVPDAIELLLFLSLGACSGVGHYLFTVAYRYAPASTLAPICYLQVVYAGLLGWLVFAQVPEPIGVGGMVVIMAAGTLIALRHSFERTFPK